MLIAQALYEGVDLEGGRAGFRHVLLVGGYGLSRQAGTDTTVIRRRFRRDFVA